MKKSRIGATNGTPRTARDSYALLRVVSHSKVRETPRTIDRFPRSWVSRFPCPRLWHVLGGSIYAGGVRIGLARVSTRDQHPEAQQDALRAVGCEQIFTDTASGVLARRPGLDQALLAARRGDQLVVTRLDRLGRSLANLIELSAMLQERGIWWCSIRGWTPRRLRDGCTSRSSGRSRSSSMRCSPSRPPRGWPRPAPAANRWPEAEARPASGRPRAGDVRGDR